VELISDLIAFNELKEARILRKAILDNSMMGHNTPGILSKPDPSPEAAALDACLKVLYKKLRLEFDCETIMEKLPLHKRVLSTSRPAESVCCP
jgi:hypothetical protein